MKLKTLTLITLTAILLSACNLANPFASDPLKGTSWQLYAIGKTFPIEGSTITISFEDGHVSGSSGCNHYGGAYKVNKDKIEIGLLNTTLMACADSAMMDQESTFMRMLGNAQRFEIVDGQLQVFGSADVCPRAGFLSLIRWRFHHNGPVRLHVV